MFVPIVQLLSELAFKIRLSSFAEEGKKNYINSVREVLICLIYYQRLILFNIYISLNN